MVCYFLPPGFKKHENIKLRAYGQRVREVEHASFTPIIRGVGRGVSRGFKKPPLKFGF